MGGVEEEGEEKKRKEKGGEKKEVAREERKIVREEDNLAQITLSLTYSPLPPPSSSPLSPVSPFPFSLFLLLLSPFLELWSWPLNTRHMWTQCWDSGSSISMMSAARRHCKDTYSTLDRYQCYVAVRKTVALSPQT